jgi:hypothetical protein
MGAEFLKIIDNWYGYNIQYTIKDVIFTSK